jgi:hypothetical protein
MRFWSLIESPRVSTSTPYYICILNIHTIYMYSIYKQYHIYILYPHYVSIRLHLFRGLGGGSCKQYGITTICSDSKRLTTNPKAGCKRGGGELISALNLYATFEEIV